MRNILLMIDQTKKSGSFAQMVLTVARQCKANIMLFQTLKSQTGHSLVAAGFENELMAEEEEMVDLHTAAHLLQRQIKSSDSFKPEISLTEATNFNLQDIRNMVVKLGIWLTIIEKPSIARLRQRSDDCEAYQLCAKLNAPVLLLSEDTSFTALNSIAYVTDLRYYDQDVIRFLKVFKPSIYVTHVTAPGLVDMDERYAQDLLSTQVIPRVGYQKIFLRNINGKEINEPLGRVLGQLNKSILAFSGNKHQSVDRLLGALGEKVLDFHQLPFLVFPYLNWHQQVSFYNNA
jgi:hypothetical protein